MSSGQIITPAPAGQAPAGFRASNGGLFVPEAHSRDRHVLTDEEIRTLDRATAIIERHGWLLTILCPHDRCKGKTDTMVIKRVPGPAGLELTCEHQTVIAGKTPAALTRLQAAQARRQTRATKHRRQVLLRELAAHATPAPDSSEAAKDRLLGTDAAPASEAGASAPRSIVDDAGRVLEETTTA